MAGQMPERTQPDLSRVKYRWYRYMYRDVDPLVQVHVSGHRSSGGFPILRSVTGSEPRLFIAVESLKWFPHFALTPDGK